MDSIPIRELLWRYERKGNRKSAATLGTIYGITKKTPAGSSLAGVYLFCTNLTQPTGALDSKASARLLEQFETINQSGQTILMVTHSVRAACHASRVLFIKDGMVYHQIYKGNADRDEMYRKINDTLTALMSGGEDHE